jgi:hypothetical protein
MVSAPALAVAVSLLLAGPGAQARSAEPADTSPAHDALAKGKYPWYDAKTDTARPVLPRWEWPDWNFKGIPGGGALGSGLELIAWIAVTLALMVLIFLLFWLWRRYGVDSARDEERAGSRIGSAARMEGLPAGLRPETDDPWTEAVRRRAAGDYAGAVICLFAHQLLVLDRLQQIRLVPGRTGRQLIRAVDNRQYYTCVEPTLRLFEAVYYGHRAPSVEAFESVWALAEGFERLTAGGAAT